MHRLALVIVLASPLAAGWPTPVRAAEPCTKADACRGQLTFSTGKKIPYYRTHPLNRPNDEITRAVIVIHGLSRNADGYFGYMVRAARTERRLEDTLIIAPRFQIAIDSPSSQQHFWSGGWSQGHRSLDSPRISSFAVIDELLAKLCSHGLFENLRCVVLAGHSAGGQFVNRYAAGGKGTSSQAVETRYLIMNPSSYLYLDARRAVSGPDGGFAIPRAGVAPDYDDYKYGLVRMNSYMQAAGSERIRSNVFSRRAHYLGGAADTGSSNLDQRGGAMAQGKNRYERWRIYRNYVQLFPEWSDNAVFESVDGVGHSGREMFNSPEARRVLFH